MKNHSLITRPTTLFILLIWMNFNITTIHAQQRWEVTQIRGDIRANGDPNPLKKGAFIYQTTPLSFSSTSDIIAVVGLKDHTPKIIQPEGFTFNVNEQKPCGHCKAVWTDPTVPVSTNHVEMIEIDGVVKQVVHTNVINKEVGIDEYWTQVSEKSSDLKQAKEKKASKARSKKPGKSIKNE